ncbi:hypothetical protein BJY04DRAFT_225985 [Aspergillus karnatakaensis]|uniref:uncharacterized protein n=1 Tax=Aspergillus karnatakaensis TaxID=1810916 RepID=UPI003CCCF7FF
MTPATAHSILLPLLTTEFPFSYAFSTQLALLKSYAIPTGTKLLVATRRLTSPSLVGKRSEDTAILLSELLINNLDSERGLKALSKMNWIHRQYQDKNQISNIDMIHTFALFVLEPLRWIDRFEWRPLLHIERVAVFVYWREIALRMGMTGVPETLDELGRWVEGYEREHMHFAASNKLCCEATVGLYVRALPSWLKGFGGSVVASLVEARVRPLLGMREPKAWVVWLVEGVLDIRAWLIRTLVLPRLRPVTGGGDVDGGTGRIRREVYLFEPWYVAEGFWVRVWKALGVGAWSGRPLPGREFLSEGFLTEEVGPREFRERSRADVLAETEKMGEFARRGGGSALGCPFAFSR